MNTAPLQKTESLTHLGLENLGNVYWDLPAPALYEEAIRRHEGNRCAFRLSRVPRLVCFPFSESWA